MIMSNASMKTASDSQHRLGLIAISIASVFSALMGVSFFMAHQVDPGFSSFSGSFIRVLTNLVFIIFLPFGLRSTSRTERPVLLSPKRHPSLWLWGTFGALTVTTYFGAVNLVGNGMAALIGASSGVFITALAPILTKQKVDSKNWVAVIGSIAGLILMCQSQTQNPRTELYRLGLLLAMTSGLFGALAYLMIARTRTRYSTAAIMTTWCVVSIIAHLILFSCYQTVWPVGLAAWCLLLMAGLAASLAQHFTTYSFQRVPASTVASLSYLAPVLSLAFDVVLFGLKPSYRQELGAGLIVAFGAILPMIKKPSPNLKRIGIQ